MIIVYLPLPLLAAGQARAVNGTTHGVIALPLTTLNLSADGWRDRSEELGWSGMSVTGAANGDCDIGAPSAPTAPASPGPDDRRPISFNPDAAD